MDVLSVDTGAQLDRRNPAVRVDNLCKRYGDTAALTGVSFEVDRAEVFGLLGPNGAGKTTALSIIAGLVRPSSGDAIVFGCRVHKDHMMVRPMIGMVSHEVALYPRLSAVENLRFFGHMYGMGAAELERRIDELLELVGLVERRRDYAATFSDGMRRRLNLAVSLLHRPQLLLLDEPTAGIDLRSREHIFAILGRLRQEGTAILYTTHHLGDAQRLCDRLVIMHEGRIVATGTPQAVTSQSGCSEVGLEAAFLRLTGGDLRD